MTTLTCKALETHNQLPTATTSFNPPPIPFFTLPLQLGSTKAYRNALLLHSPHRKPTPLIPARPATVISTVGPTPLHPYYSILVAIFHNSRKSYSSSSSNSCICNQSSLPLRLRLPAFQVPSHGPTDFQRPVPHPSRFIRSFRKDTTSLLVAKGLN